MSRRSLPIETLVPGEEVAVHMKGPAIDRFNTWGGQIIAVDGIALRLRVAWSRFTLDVNRAEGEMVIPWSRIDYVRPEGG